MKTSRKASAQHIIILPKFLKDILKSPHIHALSSYVTEKKRQPNSVPGLVREKEHHLSAASQMKRDARPSAPLFNAKLRECLRKQKEKKVQAHLSRMYRRVSAMPACSLRMRDGLKIISEL